MTRNVRTGLVLVVAALVAWATALGGGMVYDDGHSVAANEAIRSMRNVPSFFWDLDAFSSLPLAKMYRPVLLTTFAWNYAIGGGAVWVFKLTDIAIHAMNALLIFSIARHLRARRSGAFAAALLFAVHPLASEAVNFACARSDQLLLTGVLLAMRSHFAVVRGNRWGLLGIAGATFLACGVKETGVVIPGVLIALELARRAPFQWRAAAMRAAPALVVVAVYLIARKLLFGVATTHAPPVVSSGGDLMTGGQRDLATQFGIMGRELPELLGRVLLPFGLSVDPDVEWRASATAPLSLLGWSCVLLLTALGLRAPRRRPGVFVGTCVAWAIALPWVIVPLNFPSLEHRVYGSLGGIALLMAALWPRRIPRAATAAVAVVFALLSADRSRIYESPETLWASVLESQPHSVQALLGMSELQTRMMRAQPESAAERAPRARQWVERAVAIMPTYERGRRIAARVHLDSGYELGEPALAATHAEWLVKRRPNNPFHRLLLSHAYVQVGQRTGGPRHFVRAEEMALSVLEVADPKGRVFRVAAEARAAAGDLPGAIELLDRSVAQGLDHWTVLLHRAEYLVQLERRDEAIADLRGVVQQDSGNARAMFLLGQLGQAPMRPGFAAPR